MSSPSVSTTGRPSTASCVLATSWLAGCSGCHMSILDLDEWLIELRERMTWCFQPGGFRQQKEYPPSTVDLCAGWREVVNSDNLASDPPGAATHRACWVSFRDCALSAKRAGHAQSMLGGRRARCCARVTYGAWPIDSGVRPQRSRGSVPELLPQSVAPPSRWCPWISICQGLARRRPARNSRLS